MIVVLLLLLLARVNLLDQCWKTQVCLFSYLSYKVHNNYIIIIGIYTHDSEDIDSMFICEMKTLRDLSAGLTRVVVSVGLCLMLSNRYYYDMNVIV